MKSEAVFGDTKPITETNKQENDVPTIKREMDECDDQETIIQIDSNNMEEKSAENRNRNPNVRFEQEQIKQEPIDIKDEPFQSEHEEANDDETTHSNDNEINNPSLTKRKKLAKEVETIENKCYICHTVFDSKSDFSDHIESHGNMLPYKCSQCSTETSPIIFTTMVLLNRHFESHGFKYVCKQCPLRFRTSQRLSYHKKNAHSKDKREHHCETCGKVFYNSHVFRTHCLAHKNLMAQRYKCESCKKIFPTRRSLVMHQPSHERNTFVCKGANKALDTVRTEESDQSEEQTQGKSSSSVTVSIPNKCYICDNTFGSESEFDAHLKNHESMLPFNCSQCGTDENPIIVSDLTALNKHFERHGYEFFCPFCPMRFRTCRSLSIHMRKIHSEQKPEYHCGTCRKVFASSQVFRIHLIGHRDVIMQRHKCEPCQKFFSTKHVLREHKKSTMCVRNTERSRLKMMSEEISECQSLANDYEDVEQTVKNNSQELIKNEGNNVNDGVSRTEMEESLQGRLKQEIVIIKNEPLKSDDEEMNEFSHPDRQTPQESVPKEEPNEIQCFICDYHLESRSDLDDHLESHRNMLPYSCFQCSTEEYSIKISTLTALNKHFEKHSFFFVCSYCPLRFRTCRSLASHMRNTHEGQKLEFQCKICGKASTDRNAFRNHVLIHKNLMTQRYKCETCHVVFSTRRNLQTHEAGHKRQHARLVRASAQKQVKQEPEMMINQHQ